MRTVASQRWGLLAAFTIVGLLLLFAGIIFWSMFGWVFLYERAITLKKTGLSTKIDCSIVASAYDRLLANGKVKLDTSGTGSIPESDLPAEIMAIRPNYVYFDADAMYLEYGGGFHHFGLKVLRFPINDARPKDDEERMINDRTYIYDHGG